VSRLALVLLLAATLGAPASLSASTAVPAFDAVRAAHRPSDIALLARDGSVLQRLRADPTARRGPWVPLDDISPALRESLVRAEDRHFWRHGGVDWAALAAGAWDSTVHDRPRGASTLSMQLAALLDPALARPAGGRGAAAKLAQIQRARALEAAWSKPQILEAYLNLVPLRGEAVGVAAGTAALFGKHASALDTHEAALLAALVRAPNAAPAAVQRRACELLRAPRGDCAGLDLVVAQALARGPDAGLPRREAWAPHAARVAWRQWQQQAPSTGPATPADGLPSTLDARLQRLAQQALQRHLAELQGHAVADGAVLVLDNASGEVLAWVGSSGGLSQAAAVDMVTARRQAGSTLKPFVYGLALEQRLVTAASLLDDAPLQMNTGGALYRPQNHDRAHGAPVPLRTALASSLNLPAVRVGALLDPDILFTRLNTLGLDLRESAGWHGPALVLGSAEVSLLALTNAYRTLARGGVHTPVQLLREPASARAPHPAADGERVMPPAVAHLLSDILADPAARAAGFGIDSPLVTRGWAAVKTGTSKDLRDNWCVGFTDRYTVGVWVGNADGAPMRGLTGVHGAAPLWRELVSALHAALPSRAPVTVPAGLRQVQGEWFLAGTAPGPWAQGAAAFGIASPRDGTVLLLDPDIPPAAQRLLLTGASAQWFVGGRRVGGGTQAVWTPQPGRHAVERRDAQGRVLDRVHIVVRVAPSRASVRKPAPEPAQAAAARPPARSAGG
jgi:penicillin-binding protein 1C